MIARKLTAFALGASCLAMAAPAFAEPMALLDRHGSRVAVEPYAPNIVRVTIAVDPDLASAAPGEGPNAKADASGWSEYMSCAVLALTAAWP